MPSVGAVHCRTCCEIATDNFNRADSDSLGANWTEVGGSDYDISSNELLCATAGLLIHNTPHPNGPDGPHRVKRQFKRTNTSEHARVVIGYLNTSNYFYASVETISGCDVLRLFKVIGGVTTELTDDPQYIGDGAPVDTWHTLEACLSPQAGYYYQEGGADEFRGTVTLASGKIYSIKARAGDYTAGDKAGLDDSANVRADDFYFGWARDSTANCKGQCSNCKKHNTDCIIDDDTFPGGSETACKWDSGVFRIAHPDLETNQRVEATFVIDAGETAELRINSNRAGTNYHFGRVSINGPGTQITVRVGKNSTILDTTIATVTFPLPATVTLCVEFLFDTILACLGSGMETMAASPAIANGYYSGRSGGVDWDYFVFAETDPECPECNCGPGETVECCDVDLELPPFFLVRFENIVDEDCTLCENANTSWIVPYDAICTGFITGNDQHVTIAAAGDPDPPCDSLLFPTAHFGRVAVDVCDSGCGRISDAWSVGTKELYNDFVGHSETTSLTDCNADPPVYGLKIWASQVGTLDSLSHPKMWGAAIQITTAPKDLTDYPILPGAAITGVNNDCDIENSIAYITALGA